MISLELFAVDWITADRIYDGVERFEISVVGKTHTGDSVHVRIPFTPYFFVGLPSSWSETRRKYWMIEATPKYHAVQKLTRWVERVPLVGFTNNTKTLYAQLAFTTMDQWKKAKWTVQRDGLQTYDASLDPLLRFYHIRELTPASWITVEHAVDVAQDNPHRVAVDGVKEYIANFQHVGPSSCDLQPPLAIASWDIECVSATEGFPDSSKPCDRIITIGTAYQRYGDAEPFHRSTITLDTCDDVDGVRVVACANEHEVLNEWLHELRHLGADILLGYNTFGFDYNYVYGRSLLLLDEETADPLVELSLLGKFKEGGGRPLEKKLASSAYGENNYMFLTSPGVVPIDLLQIFRKELKLESYSLNNVSKHYLEGEQKIDLKPHEIFKKFQGTAADRAVIAAYCVRDVELPLKLMRRLSTLENMMQMANAVCCPIDMLQTRGQQIRVFSQLMRKARTLGFVCPDIKKSGADGPPEKYEGATVLHAMKGSYFSPISTLDFASCKLL